MSVATSSAPEPRPGEAPLDYAARGPHPVGVRTVELRDPSDPDRRLTTDLWYPAAADADGPEAEHPFGQPHRAVMDAPARSLAAPLVAFSHGNGGLRRQSTFLTTHLASWGFAVVAPDHAGNTFFDTLAHADDDERIAAHKLACTNRPRDVLAAVAAAEEGRFGDVAVDASHWLALGHSFGGWTATKLPALDARVAGVGLLAPASEPFVGSKAYRDGELPFERPTPTLVVAGLEDVLVDLDSSVRPLVRRLGPATELVGLEAADHFHFCDGIPLLHGRHAETIRPRQPRPALPYERTLEAARCQRSVAALVTWHFAHAVAGTGILDDTRLAALDSAVQRL